MQYHCRCITYVGRSESFYPDIVNEAWQTPTFAIRDIYLYICHIHKYRCKGYIIIYFIPYFPDQPHILSKMHGFLSVMRPSIKASMFTNYAILLLYLSILSIIIHNKVDQSWLIYFATVPVFWMEVFRIEHFLRYNYFWKHPKFYINVEYLHLLF